MKGILPIVLLITCVLSAVDTHLFVYPSLSRCFSLEIGTVVMAFLFLVRSVMQRPTLIMTKMDGFILSWLVFVVLHGLLVPLCEQYRTVYLCLSLLLAILLAYMQRDGVLSRRYIESVLLFVACIHLVFIIGQFMGIIESGSQYFRVTGCNENPTVVALFLVGCLPMMATRIVTSKKRIVYVFIFVVTIWGVILLRCRTAYIGMCCEAVIFFVMHYRAKLRSIFARPVFAGMIGLILLSVVVVGSRELYNMKRDSADGRWLIWKLSTEMIVEKPLGYGYGLFEKFYNLKQADYFASGVSTAMEKRNANFVFVPYNDYMEHGVEGGVIGMLFLVVFYMVMIKSALRMDSKEDVAVFCSFAVMSLFNFVYTSILPWLLLMCYASFNISGNSSLFCRPLPKVAQAIVFAALCLVSLRVWNMAESQIVLKRLSSQPPVVSDMEYAKIESKIGTSEAYWTKRAINSINANRFPDALTSLREARAYSSQPAILVAEQYCLMRMGRVEEGMKCRDTLLYMAPQKFGSIRKKME